MHATAIPELSPDATADDSLAPYDEALEPKAAERLLLLIDDSLSVRKFMGGMLASAGYEVETAVDGEEGLLKASAQNYQVIITDLEMPKLTGYEVIQRLRSRLQTQQTPIIGMSSRAGEKHRQMAREIGASSYIVKPVEEGALIQEIERLIGREATTHQ
jgi:chemosensory pili system protein ChpA (sensor histidine kinase/response regulator)